MAEDIQKFSDDELELFDHLHSVYGYADFENIGKGGMGVAIKTLGDRGAIDEEVERRFLEEAQTLEKYRRDDIVPVHFGDRTPTGRPYYVMSFIEGQSIKELIAERQKTGRGPFTVAEVDVLLRPIATVLDALHAEGPVLIHKDVKPGNIMCRFSAHKVTSTLVDFGISSTVTFSPTLPSGYTPAYTPPEIFGHGAEGDVDRLITAAFDNYALALVAFEMLTLRKPYRLVGSRAWRSPDRSVPALDLTWLQQRDAPHHEAMTRVFARALAANPVARYPDARSFIDELAVAAGLPAGQGYSPARAVPAAAVDPRGPRPRRWSSFPWRLPSSLWAGHSWPSTEWRMRGRTISNPSSTHSRRRYPRTRAATSPTRWEAWTLNTRATPANGAIWRRSVVPPSTGPDLT